MRYVDRPLWVEHYPENNKDYEYLQNHYGIKGPFNHVCVAKTPEEVFRKPPLLSQYPYREISTKRNNSGFQN